MLALALLLVTTPIFGETYSAAGEEYDESLASPESIVEAKLLAPLKKHEEERSRFSRARLPPSLRRVRILNKTPQSDAQGHRFLSFAVDQVHSFKGGKQVNEASWIKNTIQGCLYPEAQKVLVYWGKNYYDPSVLWGVKTPVISGNICRVP